MTREETKGLLRLIAGMFENKKPVTTETVDSWQFILEDEQLQDMILAVKTYAKTSGSAFPPSVAELISCKTKGEELAELSEGQAWDLVFKAISRSSYYAEEEFDKLPETIKKAVGSASQLRQWGTDESFNASVVSSNFMRAYRTVCERTREFNKLPEERRRAISAATTLYLESEQHDERRQTKEY